MSETNDRGEIYIKNVIGEDYHCCTRYESLTGFIGLYKLNDSNLESPFVPAIIVLCDVNETDTFMQFYDRAEFISFARTDLATLAKFANAKKTK